MVRKQAMANVRQASSETEITRVSAYLRVSTDEQARSGLGLDAQETRCRAMATVKGWPEPFLSKDEGVSGTTEVRRRPALRALMEQVRAGRVQAIIIAALDRLGRKTRLVLDLVEELTAHDVALVSCRESLDTTSPQGQFVLTLFAALAQLERDLIADRTRQALAEHGRRDGEKGGSLPYGYRRTDLGVRIDRSEAATVRCIFDWHAEGLSLRQIAERCTQRHAPSPRGKAHGRWGHTTVKSILANEAIYLGGQRGESAVRWPAILSPPEQGLVGHSDVAA